MALVPNQSGVIGQPSADHAGPGPRIMAADDLTGEKVVSPKGAKLGEITHIMLDVATGTIAYAVLSFGGVFGVGDKLFAVPWQSLALDVDDKWFVLNLEPEQLKNAPGFDKDHWPSMAAVSEVAPNDEVCESRETACEDAVHPAVITAVNAAAMERTSVSEYLRAAWRWRISIICDVVVLGLPYDTSF